MPEYEIKKTLIVATGHVTKESYDKLHSSAEGDAGNLVDIHPYGLTLILDISRDYNVDGIPELTKEMNNLVQDANLLHCESVRLDRDGPIYSDIPTFDWENKLTLTDYYWDCDCEKNYIHHISYKQCPHCGVTREEGPSSRVSEVWKAVKHGEVV